MHYVRHFNINGVATKQVACIELNGKPNAATEGYVGVLGIDVTSPLHDVYKCVAVNGSIYTWELLSSGLSIMSASISGGGVKSVEFPYENLRTPAMYVVKIGDLILDNEGYLYQIDSMYSTYCTATYCGTQVVAYGMSAYKLAVENGYEGTEEEWLESLRAELKTIDGTPLKIFVGTKAEYKALSEEEKQIVFAIITDDTTKEDFEKSIGELGNAVSVNANNIKTNTSNISKNTSDIATNKKNIATNTTNIAKNTEHAKHDFAKSCQCTITNGTGTAPTDLADDTIYLACFQETNATNTGIWCWKAVTDLNYCCLGQYAMTLVTGGDSRTITITKDGTKTGNGTLAFYKLGTI